MDLKQDTLDYISHVLLDTKKTVSCAESVTSGLLQFSFSKMKNAFSFFKGGMTIYSLDENVKLLNIDPKEAGVSDCVTANIAKLMALNVAKLFNTDWGISLTGYCSAVKKSENKLFAYYSIAYQNEIILCNKLELIPELSVEEAQIHYTKFILGCFSNQLNQHAIFNNIS